MVHTWENIILSSRTGKIKGRNSIAFLVTFLNNVRSSPFSFISSDIFCLSLSFSCKAFYNTKRTKNSEEALLPFSSLGNSMPENYIPLTNRVQSPYCKLCTRFFRVDARAINPEEKIRICTLQ